MVGSTQSLVGTVIDARYEVLEEIGRGGVGVVYRARRLQLDRMVAVKVLHESIAQEPAFVGRFQREALALSRLYHPHCVAVVDLGVHKGRPYLVLEYVPGQTLTRLLADGPFAPQRAVGVALQVLETLQYFHEHHVVHRDLKGENVMLVPSGGACEFVKILDFGMAKILQGRGADSQLSVMGIVPGTPSAMAPEQIQQLPPDPRIDIYGTGILLYEMIVGHRPFTGPDLEAIIAMQLKAPPPPPRQILGEDALSPELEAVLLKALEKDPLDRFTGAEDMAAALRATPEGGAASLPEPLPDPRGRTTGSLPAFASSEPPPPPARRRTMAWAPAAIVVAAALVAIGWWWSARRGGTRLDVTVAAVAESAARAVAPPPAPPPAPIAEPWRTHRDLAATYAARGQALEAYDEVQAALRDDRAAAAADPALVDAAVARLLLPDGREHVAAVVAAFRSNPRLVEALAAACLDEKPVARRNAWAALGELGAQDRVDVVAMRILDVRQASGCEALRQAMADLTAAAQPGEPRVKELQAELQKGGRKDPRVKCLAEKKKKKKRGRRR